MGLGTLKRIFGDKLLLEEEALICTSYDASRLKARAPLAVFRPTETEDVFHLLKCCVKKRINVVARGGATGRTGGSLPTENSIIIDFTSMNRILDINPSNRSITVQPGVMVGELQREVEKYNLFYPPDPASAEYSSIGGNLAENAGGLRALKYGVTRDYVLAVEVVTGEPKILRLGSYAHKSVAGYDVVRLLIGSEGTLALFTEMTLRLLPLPDTVATLCAFFRRPTTALSASVRLLQQGVLPRALEFVDSVCIDAVLKIRKRRPDWLPEGRHSLLLIDFDGSSVKRDVDVAVAFLRRYATELITAYSERRRESFWSIRRDISTALYNIGTSKVSEDVAVPLDKLPQLYTSSKRIARKHRLKAAVYGHCGDGNLHINLIPTREDADTYHAVEELLSTAVALGGTITGEHGIGLSKLDFLDMELKRETILLMRRLKRVFDPHNILNPGKAIL